jgi:hypothetical protein
MTSGSMGNVAGLLQYCVKNNYLGGASGASGIQDKLLGKKGALPIRRPSAARATRAVPRASCRAATARAWTFGGGSSDMKSKITTKVCDTVLKQGKSYLGM